MSAFVVTREEGYLAGHDEDSFSVLFSPRPEHAMVIESEDAARIIAALVGGDATEISEA